MSNVNIFRIAASTFGLEDRFTASLHYLIDCHPSIGQRMADVIADRSGIPRSPFLAAEDHPQGNDESKPDFKLICRDYELLCEHKIDSDLGRRQLERYLELVDAAREAEEARPTYLAFITNRHHLVSEQVMSHPHYLKPRDSKAPYFLWESFQSMIGEEGGRLVREFMDFMAYLEMAPCALPGGWGDLFEEPATATAFADRMRLVRDEFDKFKGRGTMCVQDPRGLGLQVRKPNEWVHLFYICASDRLAPRDEALRAPYLSASVYVQRDDERYAQLANAPRREIASAYGPIVVQGMDGAAGWDSGLRLAYRCAAELGNYLDEDVALTRARLLDFAKTAWAHVEEVGR